MRRPKLRTVDKHKPPFALNDFPKDIPYKLGREIIYLLATRNTPRLEGSDWEEIFARCIGGRWKPSNVGLDDVLLEQTAWSAKTIKKTTPSKAKDVRLISGRNSPTYSFDAENISKTEDPAIIGAMVLSIWNERVAAIRSKYHHLRTVVLIKSDDLLELTLFEFDTDLYLPEYYTWSWNKHNNLEGHTKDGAKHRFTWQPSGSQFTIKEEVPEKKLSFRLKQPPLLEQKDVLDALKFEDSWVEIIS